MIPVLLCSHKIHLQTDKKENQKSNTFTKRTAEKQQLSFCTCVIVGLRAKLYTTMYIVGLKAKLYTAMIHVCIS